MKLPDFSFSHLLVVGDVMLDTYWRGQVSRISPEAPVPVMRVEAEEVRVGGAANVALNAAVLGAHTQLLGLTGYDSSSAKLEDLLVSQNVKCNLHKIKGSNTINKLRVLSQNQQLIRLDFEDDFPGCDESELKSDFLSYLADVDVIVLSDYSKGSLRNPAPLIDAARSANKPVIVDPKGSDFTRYKGSTLITPNLSEFESIVGTCDTEADIEHRASVLRDELLLDAILITRSEKGMTLVARGHSPLHFPTLAHEVFDVTGAGDTVVATLASAIASGASMFDAALLANAAAGVVVAKLGTATVNPEELQRQLHRGSIAFRSGVLDESAVDLQIISARKQGDRIVMTNGCFDILHPGHIDYLEKASLLGDRLVVAVNDDESVSRLKGSDRPINSLVTRMRMLSALSCVDWVVPFVEDTPKRLYTKFLPDVLVKGGDYSKSQVVGADVVEASGGEVHIINFSDGHSTTNLIKRIREPGK